MHAHAQQQAHAITPLLLQPPLLMMILAAALTTTTSASTTHHSPMWWSPSRQARILDEPSLLTTIRVGKSASAQAANISAGVALVPPGQEKRWTVDVEPGIYRERV